MMRYANAGWPAVTDSICSTTRRAAARSSRSVRTPSSAMCASSVTKCLGISNADAAASAFSLCSAAARRWPCRSAMRADTERDNRGRDLPTMDRTAQRVLGPLRIVDQEMGTRQARPDSFAGDAELDAAIDMAEGWVPALDSRRVRRIGDELVETQDVEKDDVLHAPNKARPRACVRLGSARRALRSTGSTA